jgi:arylsulfatase A-like enzyme
MAAPHPLNILWITCDELRADALPCYGNPVTTLPAAERLAREGVRFERAFCQMPKCVPSRCSMLTGRYPHADGLRTLKGRAHAPAYPTKADNSMVCLQADTPNLIPYLRERGYSTALHGKNHIVEWNLHDRWFDSTSSWQWLKSTHGVTTPELRRADYAGAVPTSFPLTQHADAVIAREAVQYLESVGPRPFFALVDMHLPHPVYQDYPTPVSQRPLADIPLPPCAPLADAPALERALRQSKDLEQLSDDDRRRVRRAYYSMAEFADQQIGIILAALDRLGLTENTLVIYTSDHGDFAGDHNCYEKWDTSFLDAITRVPLILRLPGQLPAGTVCPALVELIDILPTALDLAGLPTPRWVQGQSFLAALCGETAHHRDDVICSGGVEEALWRAPALSPEVPTVKQRVLLEHPETMARAKMIRTATHKLIYRLRGEHELYDLTRDPHELVNLAGHSDYAAVELDLRDRLLRRLLESESILPEIAELHA